MGGRRGRGGGEERERERERAPQSYSSCVQCNSTSASIATESEMDYYF